jgi:hypothetical protein
MTQETAPIEFVPMNLHLRINLMLASVAIIVNVRVMEFVTALGVNVSVSMVTKESLVIVPLARMIAQDMAGAGSLVKCPLVLLSMTLDMTATPALNHCLNTPDMTSTI